MESLKLVPRYILNMGVYKGLKAYVDVEVLKRNEVYVSGYKFPIKIRPQTTDSKVFREVFLFKEYDFKLDFSPRVIIDAGANIGLASVFFNAKFPGATIYAIEPDKSNFDTLVNNVTRYSNVVPVQSALWSSVTFLKIKNKDSDTWAFEVEEVSSDDLEGFKAVSISSIMNDYSIETIDLLKLDIEGAEREVFLTNFEYWLPRTKVIIIELHDWLKEGCSRAFFSTVSKYRFRVSVHAGMLLLVNLDLS